MSTVHFRCMNKHSKASTSSTVPKSEDAKWNTPAGKYAKPGQVGQDHGQNIKGLHPRGKEEQFPCVV